MSRSIYKGPVDKAKGWVGLRVDGVGASGGGKMETAVLKQQLKKKKRRKTELKD